MSKKLAAATLAGMLAGLAGTAVAAELVPVYLDPPGDGFFSNVAPHPGSQADGNPGTTLGEQRRWAFEKALEFWELRLESGVTIEVEAEMDDLPCDSSGAVLGSAGTNTVHRDWSPGAGGTTGVAQTWYGQALANRISNTNLNPTPDIGSTYNKMIDESDSCLGTAVWYYALGEAPPGTASFFRTVVHEVGHGINFQTFVDLTSGEKLLGFDDIYMLFLFDRTSAMQWPDMSNAQRTASATNTDNLVWTGSDVTDEVPDLGGGTSGGNVKLFAPGTLSPGSSVSHWDTDVQNSAGQADIMGPQLGPQRKLVVTEGLLHDIGWNAVPANNCQFGVDRRTESGSIFGSNSHDACVSVTYDGAVIESGDTSATAGQQVTLMPGFTVRPGATFSVNTDPHIGL